MKKKYKKLKKSDISRFENNITQSLNGGLQTECSIKTSEDYLKACRICYEAIYYSKYTKELSDEELYLDNRLLSGKKHSEEFIQTDASTMLLRNEYKDTKGFRKFVRNGYGHPFHSYEILYGKIYLRCQLYKNQIWLMLYKRNDWDRESDKLIILMYNALIKSGFTVCLGDNTFNTITSSIEKGLLHCD